MVKRTRRFVRL